MFLTHDHGGRDRKTKIAKDVQEETNQDCPTACLVGSPLPTLPGQMATGRTVMKGWEPQLITEAATRVGTSQRSKFPRRAGLSEPA